MSGMDLDDTERKERHNSNSNKRRLSFSTENGGPQSLCGIRDCTPLHGHWFELLLTLKGEGPIWLDPIVIPLTLVPSLQFQIGTGCTEDYP